MYGGFWLRVCASLIDFCITYVVGVSIKVAMGLPAFAQAPKEQLTATLFATALSLMAGFCYYTFFQWRFSATVGKQVLGLVVLDAQTLAPVSIGQIVTRYGMHIVSSLCFGLGLFWVGLDKNKRGWHDKVAGTVVVQVKHLKELQLQSGIFPEKSEVKKAA